MALRRQRDLTLRRGLPVKILRTFEPDHDAVLAPGDMLYLPPAYAHDGVALDPCTTYSIGFRAATHTELAQHFLDYLRDRVELPGRYADEKRTRRASRRASRRPCSDKRPRSSRSCAGTAPRSLDFWAHSCPSPSLRSSSSRRPRLCRCGHLPRPSASAGSASIRRAQWLYDDDALYVNGEAATGRGLAPRIGGAGQRARLVFRGRHVPSE
jgi:50S ribosomal protein L16 3-hydroxylase